MKIRRPASWRRLGALAIVVAFALLPAPAAGHGLLESASPTPDERAKRPPRLVSVTLTQPPLPNGMLVVRDGCDRVVSTDSTVSDNTISVPVTDAQPGEWRVTFDFVSATDGHRYARTYGFSVAGRRDCSLEPKASESPALPEEGEDGEMGGEPGEMGAEAEAPHPTSDKPLPVTALVAVSGVALAIGVTARVRPRSR